MIHRVIKAYLTRKAEIGGEFGKELSDREIKALQPAVEELLHKHLKDKSLFYLCRDRAIQEYTRQRNDSAVSLNLKTIVLGQIEIATKQ